MGKLTEGFADLPRSARSGSVTPRSGASTPGPIQPSRQGTSNTVEQVLSAAGHPEAPHPAAAAGGDESTDAVLADPEHLRVAHALLDERLRPFFAGIVSRRPLTLSLFVFPLTSEEWGEPLAQWTTSTDSGGLFSHTFELSYEQLSAACPAVGIGYGAGVRAALVPRVHEGHEATLAPIEASVLMRIAPSGGVRVLTDLDDTIKHSDILGGVREVFRNVFCRANDELAVTGAAGLFGELEAAGASGVDIVVSERPVVHRTWRTAAC